MSSFNFFRACDIDRFFLETFYCGIYLITTDNKQNNWVAMQYFRHPKKPPRFNMKHVQQTGQTMHKNAANGQSTLTSTTVISGRVSG